MKTKRTVPLSDEAIRLLEKQRQAFIRKFGREPRDGDPVFFDLNADEPRPGSLQDCVPKIVQAMEKVGIDPALIYAFRKTGRIVTQRNLQFLTEEERQEWRNAVDDYRTMVAMGIRPM